LDMTNEKTEAERLINAIDIRLCDKKAKDEHILLALTEEAAHVVRRALVLRVMEIERRERR